VIALEAGQLVDRDVSLGDPGIRAAWRTHIANLVQLGAQEGCRRKLMSFSD
jgi:hypothetical protein